MMKLQIHLPTGLPLFLPNCSAYVEETGAGETCRHYVVALCVLDGIVNQVTWSKEMQVCSAVLHLKFNCQETVNVVFFNGGLITSGSKSM